MTVAEIGENVIFKPTAEERIVYLIWGIAVLPIAVIVLCSMFFKNYYITFLVIPILYRLLQIPKEKIYEIKITNDGIFLKTQGTSFLGYLKESKQEVVAFKEENKFYLIKTNAYTNTLYSLYYNKGEENEFLIEYIYMKSIEKAFCAIQKKMTEKLLANVLEKMKNGRMVDFGGIILSEGLIYLLGKGYKVDELKEIKVTKEKVVYFKFIGMANIIISVPIVKIGNFDLFFEMIKEVFRGEMPIYFE